MSLYDDHVTHDKQLRSLISQVTNGRRRGAIVDKELSLNGVDSARNFRTFEGSGSTNLVDPEPSKVRKFLAKSHNSSSVPYRLCRRVASQSLLETSRNRVAHHLRHGRVATWSGEFLLSAVESQFFFEVSWRSRARPLILMSADFFKVAKEVGVLHQGRRNCPRRGPRHFRRPRCKT